MHITPSLQRAILRQGETLARDNLLLSSPAKNVMKKPASCQLRYLQGSFKLKEEFASQLEAIGRATILIEDEIAHSFEIHDAQGKLVMGDAEIRRAAKS